MVEIRANGTQFVRARGMLADDAAAPVPLRPDGPLGAFAEQSSKTILVIEDDKSVNDLIALRLAKRGYCVLQAENGLQGLDLLQAYPVDLVILDIMLPSIDGWETMRRIREFSLVPVLMLTALNREQHEVAGLSLGADDYVVKPFAFSRLEVRIQALLRRSSYGQAKPTEMMHRDDVLTIDLWRRTVSVRGHPVELSPTEYRLLLSLVRHGGQVVSHEQLLLEVWGGNYDSVASLKAYIGYLRRKIEANPSEPKLIHTSWGMGYRYEPSPDS